MNKLRVFRTETDCPECGQRAALVIRRSVPSDEPLPTAPLKEACMACKLKALPQSTANYNRSLWRLLWTQSGGTLDDIPDVLRSPDDPPRKKVRASVKPPPGSACPALDPPINGGTPYWANKAYVMPETRKTDRRPRLLFVSHDFSLSGASRILANLVPALRGFDRALFSYCPGPMHKVYANAGVPCVPRLDPKQYDLVVCNTLVTAPAVAWAREHGLPCVWMIHEYRPETCNNVDLVRDVIGYPEIVIFAQKQQALNFAHIRQDRLRIIPSTIPPVPIRERKTARFQVGFPDDLFVILSCGRDEPRKGQADIHGAADAADAKVVCIHGILDPWSFYAAADVYVCSSREEVYPLAIQEAKAYGLPVIATMLPGCQDQITDEYNGLLYKAGNVAGLRTMLRQLQDDHDRCKSLGEAPINGPTWEHTLSAYERCFLEAAGSPAELPLHAVYHIAGLGDHWKEIVAEQLDQCAAAGLRRLLCTHVGGEPDWCLTAARERGVQLVMCEHRESLLHYERPAIELIERLARNDDLPILYFHSKGVSHTKESTLFHEWRRLMMKELVMGWKRHLLSIGEHDTVGVNWWTANPIWHYSGNFWLSSAAWIRRLPPFKTFYKDRFSCERWIGAVEGCRAKSLLCTDASFWDRDRVLLAKLRAAQEQPAVQQQGG